MLAALPLNSIFIIYYFMKWVCSNMRQFLVILWTFELPNLR